MRQKRVRKFLGILGLILLLVLQMGDGFKVFAAQEEIAVTLNISDEEIKPYLDLFQKQHPGIRIHYTYLENYEQDAMKRIKKGKLGDVFFIPAALSSDEYANYCKKLGNYSDYSYKYNYIEQGKRVGNSMYGIPSCAYTSGILYNTEVFHKAGVGKMPTTIDAFIKDLKDIKEYTDAVPFYTNYVSDWALQIWETFPYIDMTGNADYKENVFIKEKNPFSNGSTHYQAYKMLYDIVKDGLCETDITKGDWEKSKKLLNDGKIGCIAIGSWALSQFKAAGDNGDNVSFMPFPFNINGQQYMTINTDYCYGIAASTKHEKAAREFLTFMLEDSSYALDHETLSVVKTDPFPDSYTGIENTTLLTNASPDKKNEGIYDELAANLNLTDGKQQQRIMEAAAGKSQETFDEIMDDWNQKWEAGRKEPLEDDDSNTVYPQTVVDSNEYNITFSDSEKQYLAENPTVKVGYLKNFAPFQLEKDRQFTGISAQICASIKNNTKISCEYKGYNTKTELLTALRNGKIDMAAGITQSEETDQDIKYSKEYAEFSNVIVKNNALSASKLSKGKAVIVGEYDRSLYGAVKNYVKADTIRQAIKMVEKHKADYLITNYYSASYYVKEGDYDHITILPMATSSALYLGFGERSDTRLLAICNKCIYSIPNGKINMMLMEYMDVPQKLTLKGLIQTYPMPFLGIATAILLIIVTFVLKVSQIKMRSAKKHELDAKRYEALAKIADEYVFAYDYAEHKIEFDKKFEDNFYFSGNVNLEKYQKDNEDLNCLLQHFFTVCKSDAVDSEGIQLRRKNGERAWYRLIYTKIFNKEQMPVQIIGKLVNIQEEVKEKQQMVKKAEEDPLTGLYNREGFHAAYEKMRQEYKTAVWHAAAYLDMDNFKQVNDTLGHAGGDRALQFLSEQMRAQFPAPAVTGRFGGDEFAIYLPEVTDVKEVEKACGALVRQMNRTFANGNASQRISISMGMVLTPVTVGEEELMKKADALLYQVKKTSKNAYLIKKEE